MKIYLGNHWFKRNDVIKCAPVFGLYRKILWWWVEVPRWAYRFCRIKHLVLSDPVQEGDTWSYKVECVDKRYRYENT